MIEFSEDAYSSIDNLIDFCFENCTQQRAVKKIEAMQSAIKLKLNGLIEHPTATAECLGSLKGWRVFTYKDKWSKTLWYFSYSTTQEGNYCIEQMLPSAAISHLLEENNTIRLTESQLRSIIRETVRRLLLTA